MTGRPTAQEAVLMQLRQAIASGDLQPGQQVRQDALAKRYGVSRVPLREALKILEAEGQVTYHPHRGYFVAELDLSALREVYRIRDLLETEAVRVAVPQLSHETIGQLEALAHDVEAAAGRRDVVAMAAANRRFHFALFDASQMSRLVRLVRILWDATDAYRSLYYQDPTHRALVESEHRAVLEALRNRDTDTAVAVFREHREHAVAALSEVLGTDGA